MDHISRFRSEVAAFEKAVARAVGDDPSPPVPTCPGWSLADLAVHLGSAQRYVAHIVRQRLDAAPDPTDLSLYDLPTDPAVLARWPQPQNAPNSDPLPEFLVDWVREGADRLEAALLEAGPDTPVWTWSVEQTSGFWLRMQTTEVAIHRWDAEASVGQPDPLDTELALDTLAQAFDTWEELPPARRAWNPAPPGTGETFRFRCTDGPQHWTVRFDGEDVRVTRGGATGSGTDAHTTAPTVDGATGSGPDDTPAADLGISATASDLALFLWRRRTAEHVAVDGDPALLERWYELVPPV